MTTDHSNQCPGVPITTIVATYLGVRISIAIIIAHPEIILYAIGLALLAKYVHSIWQARNVFAQSQAYRDHAEYKFLRNMSRVGLEPWKSGAKRRLERDY